MCGPGIAPPITFFTFSSGRESSLRVLFSLRRFFPVLFDLVGFGIIFYLLGFGLSLGRMSTRRELVQWTNRLKQIGFILKPGAEPFRDRSVKSRSLHVNSKDAVLSFSLLLPTINR